MNAIHSGIAELVGTLSIAFFGTIARSIHAGDWSAIGLTYFFLYAGVTYATFKTSGAQLNPVLTIILMFTKNTNGGRAILNFCAQCIGSLTGGVLAVTIWFKVPTNLETKLMPPTVAPQQAVNAAILEGVGMFMVVLVYLCCFINIKGPKFVSGAAMGAVYLAAKITFGPVSGGAINLVEVLGPTLFNGSVGNWPVYGIGQIMGGFMAMGAYTLFLKDHGLHDEEDEPATELADEDIDNTLGLREKDEKVE
jgi:glycerol uptake facilitator protein